MAPHHCGIKGCREIWSFSYCFLKPIFVNETCWVKEWRYFWRPSTCMFSRSVRITSYSVPFQIALDFNICNVSNTDTRRNLRLLLILNKNWLGLVSQRVRFWCYCWSWLSKPHVGILLIYFFSCVLVVLGRSRFIVAQFSQSSLSVCLFVEMFINFCCHCTQVGASEWESWLFILGDNFCFCYLYIWFETKGSTNAGNIAGQCPFSKSRARTVSKTWRLCSRDCGLIGSLLPNSESPN